MVGGVLRELIKGLNLNKKTMIKDRDVCHMYSMANRLIQA